MPHWFETDPELAWGFFGHRLHLYREATPHAGFAILRKWAERMPKGFFIYTSNVDGQFQKAGFPGEVILERHGSIHHLQCTGRCGREMWPSAEVRVEVDETTFRARPGLPVCPDCGALARPNILMFSDGGWDSSRSDEQEIRYYNWLNGVAGSRVVAVEMGAGLAIPSVRMECDARAVELIRINPREPETPYGGIGLPLGAREALEAIDAVLGN